MGASPSIQSSNLVRFSSEQDVSSLPAHQDGAVKQTSNKFSFSEMEDVATSGLAEIFLKKSADARNLVSYDRRKQFLGDDNIPYCRQIQYARQCPKGHQLVPVNTHSSVGKNTLESTSKMAFSVPRQESFLRKNTNQKLKTDVDPLQLRIANKDATQIYGIKSESMREACADGDLDLVAELLDQGAGVNDQSIKGVTPLHACVFASNVELAQLLISHGADHMQSDEDGMAPIHYAAAEGSLELIRLFVQCAGPTIAGLVGDEGITPAHMAANMGHAHVILYMCNICGPQYCDQIDCRGNSPLHLAASWGHTDCVKILLHIGCNANARNSNNMTPLMVALNANEVQKMYPAIVLLLPLTDVLESDEVVIPPVLVGGDDFGQYVSHRISEHIEMKNETSLHAAVLCGSISDLRVLLFNGAKVDMYDATGFTPFHLACSKSRLDMVKLMLNFGDDVQLSTSLLKIGTIPPLISAICANSFPIVQYLVRKFPSWLDARDCEGAIPVAVALDKNCGLELVRALVVGGADLKAIAKRPKSSLGTSEHVVLTSQTVNVFEYASNFNNAAAQFVRMAGVDPDTSQLNWCDEIAKYVRVWNGLGSALIHQAAFSGRVSQVQEHLSRGHSSTFEKDAAGFTALHAACAGGFLQVVDLLLKANYVVDESDNDAGLSPLFFAVNAGFPILVERLLPLVLDASSLYDVQHRSLLYFLPFDEDAAIAISTIILSIFPFIDGLVDNPKLSTSIDCTRTSVQSAASCILNTDPPSLSNSLNHLPLLMHCRMNFEGHTLLHMACERLEASMCVECLCSIGAPVEAVMSNGLSPLHVAALYNNIAAMRILLSYGASPDLPDQNGLTPLHIVAINSYSDGIELLMKDWHAESMNEDFQVENSCSQLREADVSQQPSAFVRDHDAVCNTESDNVATNFFSENITFKCHMCFTSASQPDSLGWFACSAENCCDLYAVCVSCMDILKEKERPIPQMFSKVLQLSENGKVSQNPVMPSAESTKFGLSFNKKGIRLEFLRKFKARHSAACGHMTTEQICHLLIKPQMAVHRCSVVQQLSKSPESLDWGERSDWFVSHAWSNLFFPMIDTLFNFFEHRADAEKAIIWIDLFCISQHENPELHVSPMWWRAFSKCIEDSKRMLLIIDSWNEPKPMQRSWCMFEALTILRELAKNRGAFFKILTYEEAYDDMYRIARDNSEELCTKMAQLIDGTDVESSRSTFEEEKVYILKQLQNFGSFKMLNSNISGILEEWAFGMLRQITSDMVKTCEEDALFRFRLNLAKIFTERGRLNEALQQQELRMEWQYKLFNQHSTGDSVENMAHTVALADVLMDVAGAYARLKRFKDSLKFQKEAQKYYQRGLHKDDLQLARMTAHIAQTHFCLEEGKTALQLIGSTLEFHVRVLPLNDPRTFSAEAAVAAMHRNLQNFENAFEVEKQVLEKRLQNLPHNHPDIGSSHFNIALTLPFVESLPQPERNSSILENLKIAVKVWSHSLKPSDHKLLLAKQKIAMFQESLDKQSCTFSSS